MENQFAERFDFVTNVSCIMMYVAVFRHKRRGEPSFFGYREGTDQALYNSGHKVKESTSAKPAI